MGDELIENPRVKGISFTGSTPVGRAIAAKAGAHLKKCCVELGGKDSLIVLEDADLDRAVQAANFGSFMHQGQICMSDREGSCTRIDLRRFPRQVRATRLEAHRRRHPRQGQHHRPAHQ
jgi:acyl-CoA reductase-like NAD-dependent aldehyde dehydrogenase